MGLLINPQVLDSLLLQWVHEMENQNIYLFISSYLANKGLSKLSTKFTGQAKEEAEHAEMIFSFVTDKGGNFIPKNIEGYYSDIRSMVDIALVYKNRELATTLSLQDILDLTIELKDSVSESFVRKMIELQSHEYTEVSDFEDKANIVGENWGLALMWDLSL